MSIEIDNCYYVFDNVLVSISCDQKTYGKKLADIAQAAIHNHAFSKEEVNQVITILDKRIAILTGFKEGVESIFFPNPPKLNENGQETLQKMQNMLESMQMILQSKPIFESRSV